MANEVTILNQLKVVIGNLNYQPPSPVQNDTLLVVKGPSPGAITATTEGVVVSFSELSMPGWCRIQNIDSFSYVEYGLYDSANSLFIPLFELPPGISNVVKFSRDFKYYFGGDQTGTGTGPSTYEFMVRSRDLDAVVLVECFDS